MSVAGGTGSMGVGVSSEKFRGMGSTLHFLQMKNKKRERWTRGRWNQDAWTQKFTVPFKNCKISPEFKKLVHGIVKIEI